MNASEVIAAFITDTHGNADNQELVLSLFKQFFKLCKKHGLTQAFHGGDFFTDRKGQDLSTLYLFHEVGELARRYGVTLYIIPGNHDKTDQSSHRSYIGIYNHSHIVVMDAREPEQSFVDDSVNRVRYLLLPYFTDRVYDALLVRLPRTTAPQWRNVLLTHVGLDGVLNNRGEAAEQSIPIGKFREFDLVLIGHYHNRNIISAKVRYIGSSHQANYGEDERKGATLLTQNLKTVLVPLKSPRWLKLRLDTVAPGTVAALAAEYVGQYQHLKFEFCCTEEEYFTVDKDALRKLGIEVAWINRGAVLLTDTEALNLAATSAFTPKEVNKNFLHYCTQQRITPQRRKLGLQLIKTAFNK